MNDVNEAAAWRGVGEGPGVITNVKGDFLQ